MGDVIASLSEVDIAGADEIIPGLFVGGISSILFLSDVKEKQLGDWCIVSVLDNDEESLLGNVPSLCFDHIRLDIKDEPKYQIKNKFEEVNEFIYRSLVEKEKKVLVHCMSGISRSVTLVCAYLMSEKRLTMSKAMSLIKIPM